MLTACVVLTPHSGIIGRIIILVVMGSVTLDRIFEFRKFYVHNVKGLTDGFSASMTCKINTNVCAKEQTTNRSR